MTPKAVRKKKKRRRKKAKARPRKPRVAYGPREPSERLVSYLEAIRALHRPGKPPSATQVAELLGTTRPGARKQLMALARRGLVQDAPIEVSAGKWRLTDAGKALLASAAQQLEQAAGAVVAEPVDVPGVECSGGEHVGGVEGA